MKTMFLREQPATGVLRFTSVVPFGGKLGRSFFLRQTKNLSQEI
jgi:hypothetical protein